MQDAHGVQGLASQDQDGLVRQGPDGAAGPSVGIHDRHRREGGDIHLDAPISFPTAALGGEIKVPTLDGEAKVKIPAGTQTHTVFRLRGKGVRDVRSSGRGDQFVRVIVETPEKLTRKQQDALEQYADLSDNEPSKGLFSKLKERFS